MKENIIVVFNGLNKIHNQSFMQISTHIVKQEYTKLYYTEDQGADKDINLLKKIGIKKDFQRLIIEDDQAIFKKKCIFLTTAEDLNEEVVKLFSSVKICMFGGLFSKNIERQITNANKFGISYVFSDHMINEISLCISKKNILNFYFLFIPYKPYDITIDTECEEEILYIRKDSSTENNAIEIIINQLINEKKSKRIILTEVDEAKWITECTPWQNCKLVIIEDLPSVLHLHIAQLCIQNDIEFKVINKQTKICFERLLFYGHAEFFCKDAFEIEELGKSLREEIKGIFFKRNLNSEKNTNFEEKQVLTYVENIICDKENNNLTDHNLIYIYNKIKQQIFKPDSPIQPLTSLKVSDDSTLDIIDYINQGKILDSTNNFINLILPHSINDYVLKNLIRLNINEFIYVYKNIFLQNITGFLRKAINLLNKNFSKNKSRQSNFNLKIDQIICEISSLFSITESNLNIAPHEIKSYLPVTHFCERLLNHKFDQEDLKIVQGLPENTKWTLILSYFLFIPPDEHINLNLREYLDSIDFKKCYSLRLFYLLVYYNFVFGQFEPLTLINEIDALLDKRNKKRTARIRESYPFLVECLLNRMLRGIEIQKNHWNLIDFNQLSSASKIAYLSLCICETDLEKIKNTVKLLDKETVDDFLQSPPIFLFFSKIFYIETISIFHQIDSLSKLCKERSLIFPRYNRYENLLSKIKKHNFNYSIKSTVLDYFCHESTLYLKST